jgi:O-antigen chain-terminating methyltransferase
MVENRRSLADLLEALPEIYQPIFGHENIESSRTFQLHRFQVVRQLADDIAKECGRKLRILDFGCAQGYLSILLAQDGHSVVGVDYEQRNVDVCEALTYENATLSHNLEFVCGDVTKTLELLEQNKFDLLVAFSVFHHIVFRDGFESTTDVIAKISAHVPNLIGEFALAEEPLYWAEAQPPDPRFLLCSYPYIEQIGLTQTHLSNIQRPIIFCSRIFVRVVQELKRIDDWFYHERPVIEGWREPRRVFYCGDLLIKLIVRVSECFDDDRIAAYIREIENEAKYLGSSLSSTALALPVVLDYKMTSSESRIVRSLLPGVTLSKCITELSIVECERTVRQITHQLAILEKSNLYHSDLRTWNVLWDVSSQTASLIDFGAIMSNPTDTVPPHDPFYSYALFVQTVAMQAEDQTGVDAARVPHSVSHLESRELDQLLGEVFSQSSSVDFFQRMDEHLQSSTGKVRGSELLISRWFSSVVDYQNRINAELRRIDRDVRVGVLEQAVVDRDVRVGVLEQAVVDRDVRVGVLEQAVVDRDTTIHRVHTSLSWKVTWPVRVFFPIVRRLCQKLVKFSKKTVE